MAGLFICQSSIWYPGQILDYDFLEKKDGKDRGLRIKDRGSNEKKPSKVTEICDRPTRLPLLLLFRLIYIAKFVSSLRVHVFAFEELNTKLSVNVFLTCMIYCDAGPSSDSRR